MENIKPIITKSIEEYCKSLKNHGINIKKDELLHILRTNHYIFSTHSMWNNPLPEHHANGLFIRKRITSKGAKIIFNFLKSIDLHKELKDYNIFYKKRFNKGLRIMNQKNEQKVFDLWVKNREKRKGDK